MITEFETDLDLPDLNEFKSNLEKSFQRTSPPPLNSTNTIEASIQNVKVKRRRRKKFKAKENIVVPSLSLSPSPSITLMLSGRSTPKSLPTILSTCESTHNERTIPSSPAATKPKKYSNPLFSSQTTYEIPESPIFNRMDEFNPLPLETTLNETFLTEHDERNSQTSRSNNEWDNLSQQLPMNSRQSPQHQQSEHRSQTPFSDVSFSETFESAVERNMGLSQLHEESEQQCGTNHLWQNVYEFLDEHRRSQMLNQSFLAQQNHNISKQLRDFECFVRDKMDQTDEYLKQKLNQIEESNLAVVAALNGMKSVERDVPSRLKENGSRRSVDCTLPKIPISRDISLTVLNSTLQNLQYMQEFVSEISQIVTLYEYNPKKSVKSVMTKLFTLNLLNKYSWSEKKEVSRKPAFSSHIFVLRAIAHLLTNYMTYAEMRQEMEEFFKKIPQIYKRQKFRYS